MPREKLTDKPSSVLFPHQRADISLTRLKASIPCRQLKAFLSKNRKTVPRQNKRVVYLGVLLVLSCGAALYRSMIQEPKESAMLLPSADKTPTRDFLVATSSPTDRPSFSARLLEPLGRPGSTPRRFAPEARRQSRLAFEANQGQTDSRVKFLSKGTGYGLFFTVDGVVVVLDKTTVGPGRYSAEPDVEPTARKLIPNAQIRSSESFTLNPASDVNTFSVIRMRFVGSNRAPRIAGSGRLSGNVSYFIGNDPRQWRAGIRTYAQVRYQDLYPGVSAVYYGMQGRLEYDLVIDPGADPRIISLDFQGAKKVRVDAEGNLHFLIAGGEVSLGKPQIYQRTPGGSRKSIAGAYVFKPGGHIGFRVSNYDRNQTLTIDPVLSYSTYLGGGGYDAGTAIAVDASGNAYVTGFTRSPNFPVVAGSFQTRCGTSGTCNGYFWDAFITKFNSSGQVVYSSFLGGSGSDIGKAITADTLGSAYIAGQTFSNDFPTTAGAVKTNYGGAGDAFVAKLNPEGTALEYSTYLSGSGIDNAEGIAVDASGNAYVTGQTYSSDFPTVGPIQALNGGNQDSDAFVTEINSSGSALVYSTYLGGSSMDWGNAITVDSSGDAYVAGFTRSADFPLAGSLQATCGGCPGFADAFVAELAPNGGALLHSTYLGGSGDDHGTGITVDSDGNIYVTGFTYSADFPTTSGAYQTSLPAGGSAAFVTKIAPGFSSLVFSTYLQGNSLNYGKSIAVDTGNIFVAGQTFSPTFPLVSPTQSACAPSNCFFGAGFITELNAAGSGLIFSTYLGGSHGDDIAAIALDPSANIQVAGQAASTDFPVANALQATFGGSFGDAFISKISLEPGASLSPTSLSFSSQSVGTVSSPQTVTLSSNGTAPLHITSISTSGDFTETDNCGKGVAAGSTCTLNVTFTPTASGTRTGTLTINDNSSSSPQNVNLTGSGGGGPTLNPTSLSFGNQIVSTTSSAKTIQLKNAGNSTINISSITITGTNVTDFAQTNNCPNSLAPGAQCNINVTFTPTTIGTRTASVSVSDDALDRPQTASLTGSGISGTTNVTLTPNKLSFGNQLIGSTSAPQATVLKNTGQSISVISSVVIAGPNPGDFAQTNDCGSTVAGGAGCTFTVTLTPTASGNRSATLNITDNAGGSPQHVSLTGTGIGPMATLTPTSLSFGNQHVGTTSGAKGIQLKNTGNAALTISSIAITGTNATDFAQTNKCPSSLAPGAKCNINVNFSPTAAGTRTASLSVSDNAANSPQTVSLTGAGQ
jgi:hypothetical protein